MLKNFFISGMDNGGPVTGHYCKVASGDPSRPQVWIYPSALSYIPGEAVFNAASYEWVAGLIARERPVEQVTRNILLREWA